MAPIRKFKNFLNQGRLVLQKLHCMNLDIICEDININYLTDSIKSSQLDALLSYNLFSPATFPTRINYDSSLIIDNIFIDTAKFEKFTVSPLNGLSDGNAQIIAVHMPHRPLMFIQTFTLET